MIGPVFYRISQLASTKSAAGMLPLCKATIWNKVKAGTFPPPVKVSANVTCWRAADIEKWLANPAAPWSTAADGVDDAPATTETKKP